VSTTIASWLQATTREVPSEAGRRGRSPAALRQVESVATGKGGTFLRFERSGKPAYGQMGS